MSVITHGVDIKSNINLYNNRVMKSNNLFGGMSFHGHVGAEKYGKNGITYLRKETGLFRDWKTLLFVKNYVQRNFENKKTVNIVSGGCSTGEEAVSISILLNNLKDKVKILGIDLSKDAVLKANSRKFEFQKALNLPKMVESDDLFKGLRDRFLVFDTNKTLSKAELKQKKLFDEFFEISDEKMPRAKFSIIEAIRNYVINILLPPYDFISKVAKLKDGCVNNCTFKVGNISDINNLTNGTKSDVIFFKNAIFHIISDDVDWGVGRITKLNGEVLAEQIISKLKNNLNNGGLLCFGEEEAQQTMDSITVPKVMRKLGFKPLNKTKKHEANIWQKID